MPITVLARQGAVDAKLAKETTYGDLAVIEALCDFEGKAFNCELIRVNDAIRQKNYDDAIRRIDALIADPQVDQQTLIGRLKYMVRLSYGSEELPDVWFNKCVEYLRYIAYNQSDRDDASSTRNMPTPGEAPEASAGRSQCAVCLAG